MIDPFHIERANDRVLFILTSQASVRWRLVELGRFLDELIPLGPSAEPYLLDLAPMFVGLMQSFNPVGLTPDQLGHVRHRLDQMLNRFPILGDIEGFEESIRELDRKAALSLAFAGEISRANAILDQDVTASRLLEDWIQFHAPKTPGVLIPVIEQSPLQDVAVDVGGLRRLEVDLHGSSAERDDIRADVIVHDPADDSDGHIRPAILAARTLLDSTHPGLSGRFFSGRVRFATPALWHAGRSSDLAIAALFYAAVLRETGQRIQYEFAPDAAITGSLADDGSVLAVEDVGLEVKVTTVFFSSVRILAVPIVQLARAQSILHNLNKDYPLRRLDLIGISRLEEVFYDLRLIRERRLTRLQHLVQRTRERTFKVAAVVVVFILLLIIGRLMYGPLDRSPVRGEYKETSLVIKNADGQELEQIEVGKTTAEVCNHNPPRCHQFRDIDGDGINEIFWVEKGWRDAQPSYLFAKRVGEPEPLWSWQPQIDLTYSRLEGTLTDQYTPHSFLLGDFDHDGSPELIVTLHHYQFFPGVVVNLNPVNGEQMDGMYVHSGWIRTIDAADLNSDGIDEIILGGSNNAYTNDPTLAILDPRRIDGAGLSTPKYRPDDFADANELAYIRLPRGPIGESQRILTADATISAINVQSEDSIITAVVIDGSWEDPATEQTINLWLVWEFDLDLGFRFLETSSQYNQYLNTNDFPEPVRNYPVSGLSKELLYWNGSDWQSQPFVRW